MRFEWLLIAIMLPLSFATSAQEISGAGMGGQLASLGGAGMVAHVSIRAGEPSINLAYSVFDTLPAAKGGQSARFPQPARPAPLPTPALDLPFGQSGAVVDFYPFREGFRVSVGDRGDLTDARFMGRSTQSGGEADRVIAAMQSYEDDELTPYVGIGYGRHMLEGKLELGLDAGLLFDREWEPAPAGGNSVAGSVASGETSSDIYPVVGLSLKYWF